MLALPPSIPAKSGRRQHVSPSTDPRERLVTLLVGAQLCFLPWAFGGVDGWSLVVALGLAMTAFTVAMSRRSRTTVLAEPGLGWVALSHSAAFWAGVTLLVYLVVQTLNPAFRLAEDATRWWLVPLPHHAWLPRGMDVPFADGPLRSTMMAAAGGLTAATIGAGIGRRSSLRLLLTIVVANGGAFAVFGLLQRAAGEERIYGVRHVGFPYFFSAIIYKHHAAAFLILAAAAAGALAIDAWQRNRTVQRARSSPLVFHVFLLLIFVWSIVHTAALIGIGIFLVVAGVTIALLSHRFARAQLRAVPVRLLLAFLCAVLAISGLTEQERIRERFHQEAAGEARYTLATRLLVNRAGIAMAADRWALGWGAGCFHYGFTKYQARVPELATWRGVHTRWEHVHNDWLEFAIELGLLGLVPLVVIAIQWWRALASAAWRHAPTLPLIGGALAIAVYAAVDFPFQNPAVACTFAALATVAVRWARQTESAPDSAVGLQESVRA